MSGTALSLYDISVPVLTRALKNLSAFVEKAEKYALDNNVDAAKLTEGRLAPNMEPLTFQILNCCTTAKYIVPLFAGAEPVEMADDGKTFSELQDMIRKTISILEGADKKKFEEVETHQEVLRKLGPLTFKFTAKSYLLDYALPNFFFHETVAYAILRNAGVPLGKGDYLGGLELV